jgi:transcriptional regulator with XRE-family HTH domain
MSNKLHDRLLAIRKNFKKTQKDMSYITKVSQSNYSKYEKGTIEPGYSFLTTIVDYFSISSDWLLTGHGEMFNTGGGVSSSSRGSVGKEKKEEPSMDVLEKELFKCRMELEQLRKQNTLLKDKNEELNDEIKEKFRQVIGLQEKLLSVKG